MLVTTELAPLLRRVTLALTLSLLGACGGSTAAIRPDGYDVSREPPEIQAAYRVFAFRCSKCHSLARPLNASISDLGHWDAYVRRMRRMPGSGINERDGAIILTFLHHYSRERQRLEEEGEIEPGYPLGPPPPEDAPPREPIPDVPGEGEAQPHDPATDPAIEEGAP